MQKLKLHKTLGGLLSVGALGCFARKTTLMAQCSCLDCEYKTLTVYKKRK